MAKHNSFTCSPHCGEHCKCEDPENMACNPYWVAGYCPTDGEGDDCQANLVNLRRMPVLDADGTIVEFTLGAKDG